VVAEEHQAVFLYCDFNSTYLNLLGSKGIGGQATPNGTGQFISSDGDGASASPCGGGGGGFYSDGLPDQLLLFPGGHGFQQGGQGAIVPGIDFFGVSTNPGFVAASYILNK
jgi:hypothetical protein